MKRPIRFLLLLALFSPGCGDEEPAPPPADLTDRPIAVPQTCLDPLPLPKEDCLLLPEGEVFYLNSQAEVDQICNSPCTAALGVLVSDESDQEALKVLRRLTYVRRVLFDREGVTDMTVFSGLERTHTFRIWNSEETFSLHGLEKLKTVEAKLVVNSAALRDFEGLNSLESIGPLYSTDTLGSDKSGVLDVTRNPELESLSGLENLKEVGHLRLNSNPKLKDIDALESLERIHDGILIILNPQLNSLKGLDGVKVLEESFRVYGNSSLPQCEARALLERLGGEQALGEEEVVSRVSIKENLVTDECF